MFYRIPLSYSDDVRWKVFYVSSMMTGLKLYLNLTNPQFVVSMNALPSPVTPPQNFSTLAHFPISLDVMSMQGVAAQPAAPARSPDR